MSVGFWGLPLGCTSGGERTGWPQISGPESPPHKPQGSDPHPPDQNWTTMSVKELHCYMNLQGKQTSLYVLNLTSRILKGSSSWNKT